MSDIACSQTFDSGRERLYTTHIPRSGVTHGICGRSIDDARVDPCERRAWADDFLERAAGRKEFGT